MPRKKLTKQLRQIPHVEYGPHIASNLSHLMELAGVTWDDLEAQGINRSTINRLRTNIESATVRMLKRVATILGVSVHDLFGEVQPGEAPTKEEVWQRVLARAARQLGESERPNENRIVEGV